MYTHWQGNKSLLKLSNSTLCVLFFSAIKTPWNHSCFWCLAVRLLLLPFSDSQFRTAGCGGDRPHTMAACLCTSRGSVSTSTPRSGGNRISQGALKSRRWRRRDRDAESVEGSVRENVCNNSKKRKSCFFWIFKKRKKRTYNFSWLYNVYCSSSLLSESVRICTWIIFFGRVCNLLRLRATRMFTNGSEWMTLADLGTELQWSLSEVCEFISMDWGLNFC